MKVYVSYVPDKLPKKNINMIEINTEFLIQISRGCIWLEKCLQAQNIKVSKAHNFVKKISVILRRLICV